MAGKTLVVHERVRDTLRGIEEHELHATCLLRGPFPLRMHALCVNNVIKAREEASGDELEAVRIRSTFFAVETLVAKGVKDGPRLRSDLAVEAVEALVFCLHIRSNSLTANMAFWARI